MNVDFKGDVKACGILAVIITIIAYVIGSTYYYLTNSRDSVSWQFLVTFFIVVFVILLIATNYVNEDLKEREDLKRRKAIQIQEKKAALAKRAAGKD